ncbi:hypothetical protein [Thermococcus sp.]|uniref:hypothetical protein n=1 Tax=Thermococcus sp. TaxID=35749 RepID=UPI0025D5694D|nr:hypothetical protein [Thermococcus sp.]
MGSTELDRLAQYAEYPDMLLTILDSLSQEILTKHEAYRDSTILLAALYTKIRSSDTSVSIFSSLPVSDNYLNLPSRPSLDKFYYASILYLVRGDSSKLKELVPIIRNQIFDMLERSSHFRVYETLKYWVGRYLFLDVILRYNRIDLELLTDSLLHELINNRYLKSMPLENILRLFGSIIWKFDFTSSPETVLQVLDDTDFENLPIMAYLLWKKYTKTKDPLFLVLHYTAIKKILETLNSSISFVRISSLDESIIEILFEIGILLHYVGYANSLSLPETERRKYIASIDKTLALRMIEQYINEALLVSIEDIIPESILSWIPRSIKDFKMPLWTILLGNVVIAVISIFFPRVYQSYWMPLLAIYFGSVVVILRSLYTLKNKITSKVKEVL